MADTYNALCLLAIAPERYDAIGDGTSEQQWKQNIPLVRMTDYIAQNLFCTGARPRIAV
jgi:hypothetical protein